jgi:hypothetical protein
MTRPNAKVFLCAFFLISMLPCAAVFTATELGTVTICKGVSGPELSPVGPTNKFTPDTAVIHAVAKIKNGKPGTKVTATWISIDAISTPNYEINSAQLTLEEEGTVNAHFELSKPTKDWPAGNYKVDVFLDGMKVGSAPFSVK